MKPTTENCRLTSWLSRQSVSTKIALGFATVLALHLSVVALGHYGLQKAEHDRAVQESLRTEVETFYKIDRTVGDLQRNVLLFAFTGYEGPEGQVAALQNQLEALLDRAAVANADPSTEAANADLIETMRRHLHTHEEIFTNVVADRAKRRSLLDHDIARHDREFNESIEAIVLNEPHNHAVLAAQAAFNLAQLDVMRFANSPDSALVERAKKRIGVARERLAEASLTGEATGRVLASVDGFEAAFIQMIQATRGYLHLVNVVLAGESAEFLRLANHARRGCSKRASELANEIEAHSDRFRLVNDICSVLTIALGLVASWLIARNVAPPLNAITETIDRLAGGERCPSIPGLDRKDELGRLAHAAEVFRSKAAETQRLLDEVTRMKEVERQVAQSQKMESIGQLAAGIAHEINTPMQTVAANMDFLGDASSRVLDTLDAVNRALEEEKIGQPAWRERVRALTEEERFVFAAEQMPQAIEDTTAASRRVVEIVHAMKAMSHPGRPDLEPVDVNEMIRDAVTLTSNRWKYTAEVHQELEEGLPNLFAAASTLSQVVLNLIVNASDAIAEQQGEGGELGSIWVRTYADDETLTIEVEDTGSGIPDAIRDRVFEPFFTTKDVGKGTGQGLSFCYDAIVRRHQGQLDIESEDGVGTTFIVRLPLEFEEQQEADDDASPLALTEAGA